MCSICYDLAPYIVCSGICSLWNHIAPSIFCRCSSCICSKRVLDSTLLSCTSCNKCFLCLIIYRLKRCRSNSINCLLLLRISICKCCILLNRITHTCLVIPIGCIACVVHIIRLCSNYRNLICSKL